MSSCEVLHRGSAPGSRVMTPGLPVRRRAMADLTKAAPQEMTATLEEVVRRRADLHRAILGLERAAAAPTGGHEEQWQAGVVAALEEVEDEIVDHIEVTERDHGLYDEIIDVA